MRALAALGLQAIVVGGTTYAYDEYVSTGEQLGTDAAMRLAVQLMTGYLQELPGWSFSVITNQGTQLDISFGTGDGSGTPPQRGVYYVTVTYRIPRFSIFYGSYMETVPLIGPGEFRVPPNLIAPNGNIIIRDD